jgi:two-component system, chemotaxis family, CheB/CheR fusion protein
MMADSLPVDLNGHSNNSTPSRRLRILIVDDNPDAALGLGMLLDHYGHAVELAADGSAALEKAASFAPDVLLLDIGLPRLNGYDVARQVRASGDKKPLLIAVTGYCDAEQRCVEAGFDAHLLKPADLEYLQSLLLQRRQALGLTE